MTDNRYNSQAQFVPAVPTTQAPTQSRRQKFFINRMGTRWLLGGSVADANGIQPQAADLSLDQLQAAYLRNGGQLPWLWDTRSEAAQVDWLKEQAATWK